MPQNNGIYMSNILGAYSNIYIYIYMYNRTRSSTFIETSIMMKLTSY